MKYAYLAAAAVTLIGTAASAQTVLDTSLQNINGAYGAGVATTTTNATGTRTTVVGPSGGANRATGTPTTGSWYQANVGGGGTAGITTDYARSGNGSAFFSTTSGDSKADLQYNFASGPIALSSLTSVSFDFFRDSTSTAGAGFAPVLRLDIRENNAFAGSLVFEFVYQNQTNPPAGAWTTLSGDLNNGIFWATNASLGPTFADANGGQKTLAAWIAGNAGSNLTVSGLNIGVGSGWAGTFSGGIDNVSVNFAGGPQTNFNFEVANAVPEPATWAMMIMGFGLVGASMRRRAATVRFA